MIHKSKKGSVGVLETKYFGTRKSARYLRIYNKALERKENAKDGEEPEFLCLVSLGGELKLS